jgi:hypothetical protein
MWPALERGRWKRGAMAEENAGELEKRHRGRIGRPSRLTPEVEARILNAIRCGAPNKVACAAAGIHQDTLYGWLEKAKEQPESEYAAFSEKLTRAREEGITARLAIVMKAAKMDWRAAAWLLERDLPDLFSLKYRVEHSAAPMTIADAFRALRRRQEGRDGPETPRIEAPAEPEEE